MKTSHVLDYPNLGKYDFEELPKGDMFKVVMNPYNGKVFIGIEKHETSTVIALEILREIVKACDWMGRCGFDDPLRTFFDSETVYSMDEEGNAADVCIFEFEKEDSGRLKAAVDDVKVRKAS